MRGGRPELRSRTAPIARLMLVRRTTLTVCECELQLRFGGVQKASVCSAHPRACLEMLEEGPAHEGQQHRLRLFFLQTLLGLICLIFRNQSGVLKDEWNFVRIPDSHEDFHQL